MAIITPKLRHTVAQAFVDMFGTAKNAYFFIGRSRPWLDPEARVGTGRIRLAVLAPSDPGYPNLTLTVDTGTGNFDELIVNSTIKNLDTGEVRIIKQKNSDTQCTVNYQASVPWDTRNWAWKEPSFGFVWKDDNNPPQPNGSQYNQNESFNHMLALKKIDTTVIGQTASFVIPRFYWESETVYFPYSDNDGDLYNHPTEQDDQDSITWAASHTLDTTPDYRTYTPGSHFVLVVEGSNYYVYKCLATGYKVGTNPNVIPPENESKPCKSTSEPTYIQHNPVNNWTHTYPDGYTWKLMYTLSSDQVLRYLTDSWVPVKLGVDGGGMEEQEQYDIQASAIANFPGSIENIRVVRSVLPVESFGDGTLAVPAANQILPAQDPGTATITLPTAVTGEYTGCDVFVFAAGTPRDGQIKKIISYDSGTQIATVESAWSNKPLVGDYVIVAPHITINGKIQSGGQEASARAIVNASGYIVDIIMLNVGKNYRIAQAIASTMPNGSTGDDIPCTGVTLKAEVAPLNGHGSNAIEELGGYYLMLYLQIKNIEGDMNTDFTRDFMYSNDYRSVGVVFNVMAPGGLSDASGDTLKAVKTLKIGAAVNSQIYFQDELIESTYLGITSRGYVIEHIVNLDGTGTLTYVQDFYTGFIEFQVNGLVQGLTSSTQATISEIEPAEIADSTGDIIYIEQRKPINRAPEQLEDVKIVIEF